MSKRSMAALLKKARRRTAPFTVTIGDKAETGTFTALPYMRWHELLAEHPPREGNEADANWGFDSSTFWGALIRASATFDDLEVTDADLDEFVSNLSQGDVLRLGSACFTLNVGVGDAPAPKAESPETEPPNSD